MRGKSFTEKYDTKYSGSRYQWWFPIYSKHRNLFMFSGKRSIHVHCIVILSQVLLPHVESLFFLSYSLWRNWWLFYTALEPRNKGQGKLNLSWLFPNTNFSVRSDNFKEPIRCSLTTKIFFQLTNIHLIPQFYLHVTIHFVCTICLLKMPMLCQWLNSNKLSLSVSKSNFVIFHLYQSKLYREVNLKILGNNSEQLVSLERKTYVKYVVF